MEKYSAKKTNHYKQTKFLETRRGNADQSIISMVPASIITAVEPAEIKKKKQLTFESFKELPIHKAGKISK